MFNKRLRAIRMKRKYTQQYMADALGVSLNAYQKYEQAERSPSLDCLVQIADILSVPTDILLCRDDFLKSLGVSVDEYQ
ncbi:helix-turn-helix domain-containing protein [Laedolimicola ammoniilytica]|uniref:Helix-turn-helix transcriptional regulator n=1 Tax=Laedolimicola ammoniilytica TaxID=2981771 RepID=A0ABT2RY76_9FIRM|nr:helix-turn-helix transcriptional regulator [Laedolimicola ammoniilytica]MCU6697243.1 helix-turn-helix transcriptional regulator [Laedolimicola ammoniilytica]SCI16859.1 HTH-type transcriptional regulator immR [uncultured Clostridium sp.]